MNNIEILEQRGKFVQAEKLRKRIFAARRKTGLDGASIATKILKKIRADISEILTANNLGTAIFYIEDNAEPSLLALTQSLSSATQQVLDKVSKV